MKTASIEPYPGPRGRDGFLVRTEYDENFNAELKASVPRADWWWDFDGTTAWWVAAEHEEMVRYLLLQYFDGFEVVDPDTGAIDYVTSDGPQARQERFL